MTKLVAVIYTLSFLGFLLAHFFSDSTILAHLLLGNTIGTSTILLVWTYSLASKFEGVTLRTAHQYRMRTHTIFHLIPFSYLVLLIFIDLSLFVSFFYLPLIMLFFLTGRRTWKTLHEYFGSFMYQIFYRGNTGMLLSMMVMLWLGELYDEKFSREILPRVLLVYFTIHFFLIGIAVIKIEKDISKEIIHK